MPPGGRGPGPRADGGPDPAERARAPGWAGSGLWASGWTVCFYYLLANLFLATLENKVAEIRGEKMNWG